MLIREVEFFRVLAKIALHENFIVDREARGRYRMSFTPCPPVGSGVFFAVRFRLDFAVKPASLLISVNEEEP